MRLSRFLFLYLLLVLGACSSSDDLNSNEGNQNMDAAFKILSLGDSYTIGESVCDDCKFPVQLANELEEVYTPESDFSVKVIAQTGWTTNNLINAIENQSLASDFDLVTLLIGVNNQYQGIPFEVYESEFPELVMKAVGFAQGNMNKVIVVSIPDYGYTPFGRNSQEEISQEIDRYNDFAKAYCDDQGITFVNITDITRQGLNNPNLVASDGLHPSEIAYSLFVERILPHAQAKL